ncbi:MAG TPA: uroporphyrinogen decarboxylase family protein [bacterium]|nr:uroporphyrinogen decarboxylase family protein [bacterium]HOM27215.1 uroporphyrinogen decarboxylase family protein [bacterium]
MKIKFPEPDLNDFKKVLLREVKGSRIHCAELHIDKEILKFLLEDYFGIKWIEPIDYETQKKAIQNVVNLYYKLGFDTIRLSSDFRFTSNLKFEIPKRETDDTSLFSKGKRKWAEEKEGVIKNWNDFENYTWPEPEKVDIWVYEYLSEILPENMGIFLCISQGIFETLMFLFGFENLCYLIYDNEEIVKKTSEKIGEIIYKATKKFIEKEKIIGIFQGDDMGFKTQMLLPPEFFKKYILPWHKKLSELAHQNGKIYVLHSCGNIEPIMDDLINEVEIDAKHSFEDEILPVWKFKEKYGEKIGIIGGVDIGKLCTLKENDLRKYIRKILEKCAGSGYILGSGNSIANYIPPENFIIMLEEGYSFKI